MLPTYFSVSNISVANVYASLAGFVGFYTVLLTIEMYLMVKYARKGPASLGTGKYYGEDVHKVHVSPALNLSPKTAEVNHVV
jgi:cytochrome d ubiquinol oxidase subunit I